MAFASRIRARKTQHKMSRVRWWSKPVVSASGVRCNPAKTLLLVILVTALPLQDLLHATLSPSVGLAESVAKSSISIKSHKQTRPNARSLHSKTIRSPLQADEMRARLRACNTKPCIMLSYTILYYTILAILSYPIHLMLDYAILHHTISN